MSKEAIFTEISIRFGYLLSEEEIYKVYEALNTVTEDYMALTSIGKIEVEE